MIDLSADLGEGSPDEEEIWPLISSANVACGGHVGDRESVAYAVRRARELRVHLGAHPSYPDRANFGRKSMAMAPAALRTSLVEQIAALREVAAREGVLVHHVKPHGALYNDAHHDSALAAVIVEALRQVDRALAIVVSDTSQMASAARVAGTPVIREAFADRRYNADASLVSRKEAGSLLSIEEAADQAESLVRRRAVTARDGSRVPIAFDTICIHADMDQALERLRAVHQRLGGMA